MRTVQTNMVYFEVPEEKVNPMNLVNKLREGNILIGEPKGNKIRVVTHKDINRQDISLVIQKIQGIMG